MGNVSCVIPAIHPFISIGSWPATNHQPEFAACCVTPAAEQALIDAAIAMSWTAADVACDQAVRASLLGAKPLRAATRH